MTKTHENHPVIMITGGSQGLGLALARVLLKHGFAVSVCARSKKDLSEAQAELEQYGPVVTVVGDVCDAAFRSRYVTITMQAFGRIDAVVNNASTLGTVPLPNVLDTGLQNIQTVMETNLVAPVALIQATAPYLVRQKHSLYVAISSDAAVSGYPGWGIYGASKAALDAVHKSFASEVQGIGIMVYTVDPGDMDTAMHRAAEPSAQGLPSPDVAAVHLISLFTPLLGPTNAAWPFASGSRLAVGESGLREVK